MKVCSTYSYHNPQLTLSIQCLSWHLLISVLDIIHRPVFYLKHIILDQLWPNWDTTPANVLAKIHTEHLLNTRVKHYPLHQPAWCFSSIIMFPLLYLKSHKVILNMQLFLAYYLIDWD
jgi:hypothetical protein